MRPPCSGPRQLEQHAHIPCRRQQTCMNHISRSWNSHAAARSRYIATGCQLQSFALVSFHSKVRPPHSCIRNLDNAKNAFRSPKVPWFPPACFSRSISWERQGIKRPHLVRGCGTASGHHPRCEDKAWIGGGAHLYSRKFALSDGEHGRNLL